MLYKHTEGKSLDTPEVVLNLWAYVDEGGYIQRVPEAPLCVTTQILEFEDGRQVPLLNV